jgi:hypothetical protein
VPSDELEQVRRSTEVKQPGARPAQSSGPAPGRSGVFARGAAVPPVSRWCDARCSRARWHAVRSRYAFRLDRERASRGTGLVRKR